MIVHIVLSLIPLAYSLWRSLQASDNSLVNAVLASDLFLLSPVCKRWGCTLF